MDDRLILKRLLKQLKIMKKTIALYDNKLKNTGSKINIEDLLQKIEELYERVENTKEVNTVKVKSKMSKAKEKYKEVCKQYKELFGKEPHPAAKTSTLEAKIAEELEKDSKGEEETVEGENKGK